MTGTERLSELADGRNPLLVARLKSGFAVMADSQYLPGYCLLLAYPEANHLTDLSQSLRAQYLLDMSHLGEAVMEATNCLRVNYSILGNLDPFLHAHVWPRYSWEDDQYRLSPPTDYPPEYRDALKHGYDPEKHDGLRQKIAQHLQMLSGGDLAP